MPAAAAFLIRTLIQALQTAAILAIAEKFILPLIEPAIKAVAMFFGCTEEEAQDLLANEFIQFAETTGILAITIRSKLPTKIAERLGFTSKGFNIRKLSPTLAAKVGKVAPITGAAAKVTAAEIPTIASTVAATRGLNTSIVSSVFNNIFKVAGLTTAIFFAAAQYIDFANWEGPYQGTFQKIIGFFGLEADRPNPKARTISNDVWTKIYATVEELNPETIAFPWLDETRPYSRQALADAVDHFAANLSLGGRATSFKEVFALLLPCIKLKGKTGTSSSYSSGGLSAPKVQVYSGVLSQGILGDGVAFQARENDMIDNPQELADSAGINLAPFLSTLASRVLYELKIVPSIISKDGFTQRGTSVQVISSYTQSGQPRYKTITNKFAVLELFLLNDKNQRVKINRIVLGPVNALNFQVTAEALSTITTALKGIVSTTNIEDIKGIATVLPIVISNPDNSKPKITPPIVPVGTVVPITPTPITIPTPTTTGKHYVIGRYGSYEMWDDATFAAIKANPSYGNFTEVTYEVWKANTSTPEPLATSTTATQRPGANATTLAEWYTANGQSLPSVQARSLLYQQYGLGNSSLYIGSVEQNTRLLEKLKGF